MIIPTAKIIFSLKTNTKPYGLMDEALQKALFSVWNEKSCGKSNIQVFMARLDWTNTHFSSRNIELTYRLDPCWQPPKEKRPEFVRYQLEDDLEILWITFPNGTIYNIDELPRLKNFVGYEFPGGWVSTCSRLYFNEVKGQPPDHTLQLTHLTSAEDLTDPAEGYKVGVMVPVAVWFKNEPESPDLGL